MAVGFIFGVAVGLISGVLFHYWWTAPDFKNLKRRITVLEDERNRLTKQVLKQFRVSVVRGEAKNKDG